MIARELIEDYGMKQELVAERLGVTQAAVSKYRHQVRGEAVDLEGAAEVRQISRDIASTLVRDPNPLDVSRKFCQASLYTTSSMGELFSRMAGIRETLSV